MGEKVTRIPNEIHVTMEVGEAFAPPTNLPLAMTSDGDIEIKMSGTNSTPKLTSR